MDGQAGASRIEWVSAPAGAPMEAVVPMLDPRFYPVMTEDPEDSLRCCVASIYGLAERAVPDLKNHQPQFLTWEDALNDWLGYLNAVAVRRLNLSNALQEWLIGVAGSPLWQMPLGGVYLKGRLVHAPCYGDVFVQLPVAFWLEIESL